MPFWLIEKENLMKIIIEKINNFNNNETKFTDFIRFHTVGLLLELGFDIVIHGTIIALFYC